MHNKLLELLDTNDIHRETESFSTDPHSALEHLQVNYFIPAVYCLLFTENYTRVRKSTLLSPSTLPNVDRFSKVFHQQT